MFYSKYLIFLNLILLDLTKLNLFYKKKIMIPTYLNNDNDTLINSSYTPFNFYSFLLKSDLLFYFKGLEVDTPKVLNSVTSYKRTQLKTKTSRLVNYLQRSGKKQKYFILFFLAYFNVLKKNIKNATDIQLNFFS